MQYCTNIILTPSKPLTVHHQANDCLSGTKSHGQRTSLFDVTQCPLVRVFVLPKSHSLEGVSDDLEPVWGCWSRWQSLVHGLLEIPSLYGSLGSWSLSILQPTKQAIGSFIAQDSIKAHAANNMWPTSNTAYISSIEDTWYIARMPLA